MAIAVGIVGLAMIFDRENFSTPTWLASVAVLTSAVVFLVLWRTR